MHTGTKIKELRKTHNMTQEELGELLGVKKAAIQKYEKGEIVNLKLATIQKLCEIFNVEPGILIFPDAEKFERKYNNMKELYFEVKTIESVEDIFGPPAVKMLEEFTNLNDEGQNRALELCSDLSEIPKYQR